MNRKPTAQEWLDAFQKYPGRAIKHCKKAQEKIATGVIIHPSNEYCYYCRPRP